MLDPALFVSDTLHPREVELAAGQRVTLHFRELPASEFIRFQSVLAKGDEDARAGAAARLIAASLANPDGTPALTLERALQLKTKPLDALFTAVLDVNEGKPPGKPSPSAARAGSGMSSL